MDNLDKQLRKLAKSQYWQSLYSASKNHGSIFLFNNQNNLSSLQIRILYWSSVYDMLYLELAKHEDDYLSENVINNDWRTDCYLIYRNKKHDFLWKKHRQEERARDLENSNPNKKRNFSGKKTVINMDMRRE